MLQNKGNSSMLTIMFICFEIIHFYIYSFVFSLIYFFILMCLFFWRFLFPFCVFLFFGMRCKQSHRWVFPLLPDLQHKENTFMTTTFLKKGPKVESTKTSKEMVSMLIFADCMRRTGLTEPSSLWLWGYWLLWQMSCRHIHGTATRGYHPRLPG